LSGRRIAAMVVNDYACELDKRGALESIASRLAPTILRECVRNPKLWLNDLNVADRDPAQMKVNLLSRGFFLAKCSQLRIELQIRPAL